MRAGKVAMVVASMWLLALSHSHAFAENERIDASVGILVPQDGNAYMRGTPSSWREACHEKVNLGEVLARAMPPALSRVFQSAKLVNGKENSQDDGLLFVRVSVGELTVSELRHPGFVGGTGRHGLQFDVRVAVESREGAIWNTTVKINDGFDYVGESTCVPLRQSFRQALEGLFEKGLLSAVREMQADKQAVAAINEVVDGPDGGAAELAGLQALLATYRVTDSEATIRRKPQTSSSVVRKIKIGGILQIVGQLPSGWLQVAKEGDPIGWVHSGSVTALSIQQQPAIAAAPAKPAKPAPIAVAPAPTFAAAPAVDAFPTKPVAVSFPRAKPAPDDIAVIIGNANYKATAKDIPDVVPAYADAEGMKRYAVQALGIREENVIFIKDAKLKDMVSTFGSAENFKGKLFNWVKPGQSNVFVFYSGHGAPNGDGSNSYLVPTDAEASLIDLSGYSLKTLYGNLGKLPAKSITVVLEACFSGASQSGMLVKNASPIYQKAMAEIVPANLTVISAGSGNQIASWEQDKSHGLFTKHYLLGMAGAADKKPYGNGDGKVSTEELTAYLKGTMSYMAQRYYGREQTVQVATGAGR